MIKGDNAQNTPNRYFKQESSQLEVFGFTPLGPHRDFLVINDISEIIQRSIPVTDINHAKTYSIILNNRPQPATQSGQCQVPPQRGVLRYTKD